MNNHHTTEDPKNIRMTEEERSTLHASIMKQVGIPNIQPSPVTMHPSYWLSSSVFKPVFLALFLLMISTSGILLYQERAIKETKEETTPIENKPEEQVPTESADTMTAPVNTAVQEKTLPEPQSNATIAPMQMRTSTTSTTSEINTMSKMRMVASDHKRAGEEIYAKDDGYNDFTLILKQDGDLTSIRYINVLDGGKYINASDESDYAATFKTDEMKDNMIILNIKNYRFFDPQEYVKIKLIFDKDSQTIEWISLDEIAPYLPQKIVVEKI